MSEEETERVVEALRVSLMRRENGQASAEEVQERRAEAARAAKKPMLDWWTGLTDNERGALREADGQADRVAVRAVAVLPDGTLSEVLFSVTGTFSLPSYLLSGESGD